MVKLWAKCHNLAFPDVCVEIMVAEANCSVLDAKYKRIIKKELRNEYYKPFYKALIYIRDNILTEDITFPRYLIDRIPEIQYKDRVLIRKCARESLKQSSLKDIVWEE